MMPPQATWALALREAGCYDFLKPLARKAVSSALERSRLGASLAGADGMRSLQKLCVERLSMVYERPLLSLALKLAGPVDALELSMDGAPRGDALCRVARRTRDEVMADGGKALRAGLPQVMYYERAIADNFTDATAELLDRLALKHEAVSQNLLDRRALTCVTGVLAVGDPHRHGRAVLCVNTDAGAFLYKPRNCQLDALFAELASTWLGENVRVAKMLDCGDHAFVERLVPEEPADQAALRTYWRNMGRMAALFHGLGSRDMTQDNIMCCGDRPAVLDLETLLTGWIDFDEGDFGTAPSTKVPASGKLATSLASVAMLPARVGDAWVSPLVADSASGTCLPRVDGKPRSVLGSEGDLIGGFEEEYRLLMAHRADVLATLERYASATCRQILLNTGAYAKARTRLFSPSALSNPAQRDAILAQLNSCYSVFSAALGERVAPADAAALSEGDIPTYCARADSRMLFTGERDALGTFLARSPLEAAAWRLRHLSEEELVFEIALIEERLAAWEQQGGVS